MIPRYGWLGLWLAAALVGCSGDEGAPAAAEPPPRAGEDRGRIVFLGTSLTAGLGLDPDQAFPALIQQKLDSAGLRYVAVNAGVSGETSAGARRRIDWLLRQPASVLVIETGANDGLRGLPTDSLRANIQAIVDRARKQTPPPAIVLVGMRALPNFGLGYGRGFRQVYDDLTETNDLSLVPFLLEEVAGVDSLNQPDMIHPTAAGHRLMAETVWEVLAPVLLRFAQNDTVTLDSLPRSDSPIAPTAASTSSAVL
ncbi:MAG: arylesterase [Gemmatimonadales bacterium]|nr:arylesterase [Gemmatimonadales bacterium]